MLCRVVLDALGLKCNNTAAKRFLLLVTFCVVTVLVINWLVGGNL